MKYSKELIVGLSLVVAAVIFVLGVRYFEDLPLFRGTYQLNTTFQDAGGLQSGNAVRVNGVRVGAVDEVDLDTQTNNVRVRFHVEESLAVPEGSFTTLGGIAALGSIHMNVSLGPAGNDRVSEGGFIPSRTEGGLLESVTERAPALAQGVESVLTNANQTLEEAEVLFRSANGDVQQTLTAFKTAAASLERLIRSEQANISQTMSNLQAFSGDMSDFTSESADSLSLAVQKLNRSMTRLEASLETVDRSTAALDEILYKINNGDGTMARLVNDPSLYVKMDSSLTTLNALLEAIRDDPEKYLKHMSLVDIF